MNQALSNIGQPLVTEHTDVISVFEKLSKSFDIVAIYSHQESGNLWTYERDKDVLVWSIKNNIKWHESEPYGVFRRFNERDYWSHYWEKYMDRKKSIAHLFST